MGKNQKDVVIDIDNRYALVTNRSRDYEKRITMKFAAGRLRARGFELHLCLRPVTDVPLTGCRRKSAVAKIRHMPTRYATSGEKGYADFRCLDVAQRAPPVIDCRRFCALFRVADFASLTHFRFKRRLKAARGLQKFALHRRAAYR